VRGGLSRLRCDEAGFMRISRCLRGTALGEASAVSVGVKLFHAELAERSRYTCALRVRAVAENQSQTSGDAQAFDEKRRSKAYRLRSATSA